MGGSKADLVTHILEVVRQRALTNELGQVPCSSRYHWLLDISGSTCSRCGAAV